LHALKTYFLMTTIKNRCLDVESLRSLSMDLSVDDTSTDGRRASEVAINLASLDTEGFATRSSISMDEPWWIRQRPLPRQQSLLYWAVSWGLSDIVCLMMAEGAVASHFEDSTTPLMLGSSQGQDGVVRLLLDNNRNLVETHDDHGRKAIHYAASVDCKKVVETLLGCGAAIDARDAEGATALY